MKKILTIAGSDPSAGAGIQADLKTIHALGAYGLSVTAALTAQNSRGVSHVYPLPPTILSRQLELLLADGTPDAVKTGMLFTRENVEVVSRVVRRHRVKNLVVDPVLRSSSGRTLLRSAALASLKKNLLPLALIVTPNLPEAEIISGVTITSKTDMERAAVKLLALGPSSVLIKGGHGAGGAATDTLYGGKKPLTFSTPRRRGEFHGTGCVLSSAIAVFIGRGYSVEKAVEKSKAFVDKMLKTAKPMGKNKKMLYFQF